MKNNFTVTLENGLNKRSWMKIYRNGKEMAKFDIQGKNYTERKKLQTMMVEVLNTI